MGVELHGGVECQKANRRRKCRFLCGPPQPEDLDGPATFARDVRCERPASHEDASPVPHREPAASLLREGVQRPRIRRCLASPLALPRLHQLRLGSTIFRLSGAPPLVAPVPGLDASIVPILAVFFQMSAACARAICHLTQGFAEQKNFTDSRS